MKFIVRFSQITFLSFSLLTSSSHASYPHFSLEEERMPLGPLPESLKRLGEYDIREAFPLLNLGMQENRQNQKSLVSPSPNSLESWWTYTLSKDNYGCHKKLPTQDDINSLREFLKTAPSSFFLQDGGGFLNQFTSLVRELGGIKLGTRLSEEKLQTLLELGTQFFSNFWFYTNCWLIDQAKSQGDLSPPPLATKGDTTISREVVCKTYSSIFEKKFLIFQRTCNYFFDVLAFNKKLDAQESYGILPSVSVQIANQEKFLITRLGFIKDPNGYIPFYAGSGTEGMQGIDLEYGSPLFVNQSFFPRTILVNGDKVIGDRGLMLAPYDHPKLPAALKMYGGDIFCTWKSWTYISRNADDLTTPLGVYLQKVFDFKDVIENRNYQFVAVPTTPRDKTVVTLMLLENLMKEKSSGMPSKQVSNLIVALEKGLGESLETIKSVLEEEILERIVAEEEEKQKSPLTLENRDYKTEVTLVEDKKSPLAQGKKEKGSKKTREQKGTVEKKKSSAKSSAQREPAENIRSKARGLLEKYKVEGRQRFAKITTLLNHLLKDKESFEALGVDLNEALATMRVTENGSHFTYHIEGAKTTTTLVNKHKGARDHKYHASEVNNFTENLIMQIISVPFKGSIKSFSHQ